jgi:hypothetical protein
VPIRVTLLIALAAPLTQQLLGDQARDARWKQDVATFSNQLPARAANLFFLLPRAQFNQAVADLTASIPSLPGSRDQPAVFNERRHLVFQPH